MSCFSCVFLELLPFLLQDAKNDDNTVSFFVRFDSDKATVRTTTIILKANNDDIRYIPIEIKSIEKSVIEPSVAYLDFTTPVFDTIVQTIPIVSNNRLGKDPTAISINQSLAIKIIPFQKKTISIIIK